MKFIETRLPGCFKLQANAFTDFRGKLVKYYMKERFDEAGINEDFKEAYFSHSPKGVLRGLHFQNPPHAHGKLVGCVYGRIFDVAVDLRKNSPTYGQCEAFELSGENAGMVWVPEGFAHGFCVLSEEAIFLSQSTHSYAPGSEGGIRWDSIDIEWPLENPVISEKDRNLVRLEHFNSPF